MQAIPEQSFGVVVTSPPYNIGVKYRHYQDKMQPAEYLLWIDRLGQEIFRILEDDGSFFINVGSINQDPWISVNVASMLRTRFVLQNHFIWVKSISISDNSNDSYGHFKPVNSKRYVNNAFEDVYHFTKHGNVNLRRLDIGVPYKDKSNTKHRKTGALKLDRRCRGNVWFIPYDTVQSKNEKYNHPASFPVALPEMCIRLHGIDKNPKILDPFVGIGSTLVATQRLGLAGVGIDSDEQYCRDALKRLTETPARFSKS